MENQLEGLVTIERWDGNPEEGGKLIERRSVENALAEEFKKYIFPVLIRYGGIYLPEDVLGDKAEELYGSEFLKDRGLSSYDLHKRYFAAISLYLTEKDTKENQFLKTDVVKKVSKTGNLTGYYLNKYNKDESKKLIFVGENSINFPNIDIKDSNIVELIEDDEQAWEAMEVQLSTLYNKKRLYSFFDDNANCVLKDTGIAIPFDLAGKTLKFKKVYRTTNTLPPSGVSLKIKTVGLGNDERGSYLPITEVSLGEDFVIDSNDYIKISYDVIVSNSILIPEGTTNNKVEIFGKEYTYAEKDFVYVQCFSNDRLPQVLSQSPKYQKLLHALVEKDKDKDFADRCIESLKKRTTMIYSNQKNLQNSITASLVGGANGYMINSHSQNNHSARKSNSTLMLTSNPTNMKDHFIPNEDEKESVELFGSIKTDGTMEEFKTSLYAAAKKTVARNNNYGNPYWFTYFELSGERNGESILDFDIQYNSTLDGKDKGYVHDITVYSSPANMDNLWEVSAMTSPMMCVFFGCNIVKHVHFNEPLIKDHLNSFKWVVPAKYHTGNLPDDSGKFLDELRSSDVDSYAKSVLLAHDEGKK